jgi:hypothetical protein
MEDMCWLPNFTSNLKLFVLHESRKICGLEMCTSLFPLLQLKIKKIYIKMFVKIQILFVKYRI